MRATMIKTMMASQITAIIVRWLLMLTRPTAIVCILFLSNLGSNRCSSLGDGVGDACQNDEDGDGVIDSSDACPKNSGVTATDFSQFQLIYFAGTVSGIEWVILNQV